MNVQHGVDYSSLMFSSAPTCNCVCMYVCMYVCMLVTEISVTNQSKRTCVLVLVSAYECYYDLKWLNIQTKHASIVVTRNKLA